MFRSLQGSTNFTSPVLITLFEFPSNCQPLVAYPLSNQLYFTNSIFKSPVTSCLATLKCTVLPKCFNFVRLYFITVPKCQQEPLKKAYWRHKQSEKMRPPKLFSIPESTSDLWFVGQFLLFNLSNLRNFQKTAFLPKAPRFLA